MIRELRTSGNRRALTSDLWHVVHARWSGFSTLKPRFERTIVSEHSDLESAVEAARNMAIEILDWEMMTRSCDVRDQVFVRRPGYGTLKIAGRVRRS